MRMHNPPHPGEFIKLTYIEPYNIPQNVIARQLSVARSTFNRIIRGSSAVTPEMALRLSQVIGRTPESWLAMQASYDLYIIEKSRREIKKLKPLKMLSTT